MPPAPCAVAPQIQYSTSLGNNTNNKRGKGMKHITFNTAVLSSVLALGAISLPATAQNCTEGQEIGISGKITNNAQDPLQGFTTLGVVALKTDLFGKMKCGIIGQQFGPVDPTKPSFIHTISCDDNIVPAPDGASFIHSQLTLQTNGTTDNFNACPPGSPVTHSFSFHEDSSPWLLLDGSSTGRGIFTGVKEGQVSIDGNFSCFGSIDMEFSGYVCSTLGH
jgi:hypothetical protein